MGIKMSDNIQPIRINRNHAVWPNEVREIKCVLMSKPGGWVEVLTHEFNFYQTELVGRPDPEYPVEPEEICRQLVAATGIEPTVVESDKETDRE